MYLLEMLPFYSRAQLTGGLRHLMGRQGCLLRAYPALLKLAWGAAQA